MIVEQTCLARIVMELREAAETWLAPTDFSAELTAEPEKLLTHLLALIDQDYLALSRSEDNADIVRLTASGHEFANRLNNEQLKEQAIREISRVILDRPPYREKEHPMPYEAFERIAFEILER